MGARGGAATGERTPIPGGTEPPKLLFHEAWIRAPLAQPITQANLGKNLVLHVYGNADHIRKAMHPLDDYTCTGETTPNWALTVSDQRDRLQRPDGRRLDSSVLGAAPARSGGRAEQVVANSGIPMLMQQIATELACQYAVTYRYRRATGAFGSAMRLASS